MARDADEQYQSEQTLAAENWDRYQYVRDRGHDDYCKKARRLEDFVLGGGEQWSEADKAALAETGRIPLEFNEILPAIKATVGYQIANRMDIAFRPRGGQATQEIANILCKVAMQIADNVSLHHKETEQFADGMIQRRGYLSIRMDFDDSMRGEVRIDVEDPLDVLPDPDAKGYDPDTWGDFIVTRWLTLDEIEQRYGKEARDKAEIGSSSSAVNLSGDSDFGEEETAGEVRNKFGSRNGGVADAIRQDKRTTRLRIIDRQWFVFEMSRVVVSPNTGDIRVIEGMQPEQIQSLLAEGWVPSKRMAKRVRWRVTTWNAVLHDDYSPYPWLNIVPFFPIFRRGRSRGMVDNAIGPQEALNKLASQFIHIINTTANSGWMVEENSLTNMEVDELETEGSKSGLVIEHKTGQKPEKIQPNQVPTGVDRMMQVLLSVLKENTAPDSMRGIEKGGGESGIAIQSRQFAAQQQLTMELDNLSRSRNMLVKRLLWCIQNYYDDQRLFRITKPNPETGDAEEEQIEINVWDEASGQVLNNITLGEYDVIVSETPMQVTFENGQFEQAVRMRELIGDEIPSDVLIRNSALADKNELIRRNAKRAKTPDPLTEAEIALKAAQTRKANAEATSKKVETIFSGVQTGQLIAMNPAIAPLSDVILRSGGFEDEDAAPIVPSLANDIAALPPMTNTNPLTPANPAVGMNAGIEGGAA